MQSSWSLFWVTFLYAIGHQFPNGCCEGIRLDDKPSFQQSQDSLQKVPTSSQQDSRFLATMTPSQRVAVPFILLQKMARKYPSHPSAKKYWEKKSQLSYYNKNSPTKLNLPFKPNYKTSRRKSSKDSLSKLARDKNSTRRYHKLKERLTKSYQKAKPVMLGRLFSLLGLNSSNSTALAKRDPDIDVYDDDDYNQDETGLAPTDEPRTGLVLATVVSVFEAIVVITTTLGFGGVLLLGLVLLVKLVIKGILLAMVTIYLL